MAISVVMPALEMAQETGKLVSWLKKEGDRVSKGELLLEIETDKAVMEIESPGDGVLTGIKAEPGAEIAVGKTIAWIVQPGEALPAEKVEAATGRHVSIDPVAARPLPFVALNTTASSAELRVSPKARRLAKERSVDLTKIVGSGPGGEILAADVGAAAVTPPVTPALNYNHAIARLMAKRTTEAWRAVPHFFIVREVDAGGLLARRERYASDVQDTHQTKLTITDLLVWSVARVLQRHPQLNASWSDEGVRHNPEINISVAMAIDGAVVAPVIQRANQLELGEIALRRSDLSDRTRASRLRPADITGGSFTISNLGMFGVDQFTALITPPQAAILAVGRISDRVVAINGQPAVRPMMTLTLSSDHRVVDGATSARFLQDLVSDLECSLP